MVSIPRDIWVDSLKAKVNSAYFFGKEKSNGDSHAGIVSAKATVEEIVGVPIHYALVLDFSGFTRIIDELGGIEVNVENSFTDTQFPIPGRENDECNGDLKYACRYETISFEKGTQMMDGQTALKFARSRHAEGDEGTDFARAARQQKVIDGIKNKILSLGVIFSPEKINALAKVVEGSIETDMDDQAGAVLARVAFDARDNVQSFVLGEDLLYRPPISRLYQNQYVFVPKSGDWKEIHSWIQSILP
jgi:LCP family protein required for cell wall assembly